MLGYIGVDYPGTVSNGKITNARSTLSSANLPGGCTNCWASYRTRRKSPRY